MLRKYSNMLRTQIELQVMPKALHHNICENIYDGTKVEITQGWVYG